MEIFIAPPPKKAGAEKTIRLQKGGGCNVKIFRAASKRRYSITISFIATYPPLVRQETRTLRISTTEVR